MYWLGINSHSAMNANNFARKMNLLGVQTFIIDTFVTKKQKLKLRIQYTCIYKSIIFSCIICNIPYKHYIHHHIQSRADKIYRFFLFFNFWKRLKCHLAIRILLMNTRTCNVLFKHNKSKEKCKTNDENCSFILSKLYCCHASC